MPAANLTQAKKPPTIAIIGGGFTGAAVAWNLARKTQPGHVRIVIYEPRARLGGGLAYDTADPAHRINVPADRMSLDLTSLSTFSIGSASTVWVRKTGKRLWTMAGYFRAGAISVLISPRSWHLIWPMAG